MRLSFSCAREVQEDLRPLWTTNSPYTTSHSVAYPTPNTSTQPDTIAYAIADIIANTIADTIANIATDKAADLAGHRQAACTLQRVLERRFEHVYGSGCQ